MPIRIVDDPGQGGGGGRRNPRQPGGGGGGNIIRALLPLLISLFRRNPKMGILLLVIGGALYFFTMRNSSPGVQEQLVQALGCDMSPEQYAKSEIYEPLATNYKGSLPRKVSLEKYAPRILNQGRQGSCVGWASSYAARTILHSKATGQNPNEVAFSPASLYNQISLPNCQGAYIHNAMDKMKGVGVLPWEDFGYNENSCSQKLTSAQHDKASQFTTKGFQRLWKNHGEVDVAAIKQNLAQGAPVVIGMMVGGSFMQQMQGKDEWRPTNNDYYQRGFGGHAMCIIGYDDDRMAFQIMNSWGPEWGRNGIAWVSYDDFAHFTREAYGLYPMGDAQAEKPEDVELAFGLVDNETKKNIELKATSKKGLFRTASPIKKNSTFKIEVTNNVECYTYVLGMETDGSSYVLFPYSKPGSKEKSKHSPYCGIVGTRLFPRYQSLMPDELGEKDYMSVIISKEPIDFQRLNDILNEKPNRDYYTRVRSALRRLEVDVNYDVGSTINMKTDADGFQATSLIFEIEKE